MRIAIDCRSVFPGMGGIGHHAEQLVRAIAEQDGRATYALLFTERKKPEPLTRRQSFQELVFPAGMIDERWEQIQLPTVLADNEIDLYHSTCFSLPVVKTTEWRIATVHDVVFRTRPDLVAPKLCDYLDTWTEHSLEVADAVITVSEFSKGEITRAYGTPPEKVHVIYNGIEPRFSERVGVKAKKSVRKKYGLPEKFVLYVGSLEPKKNIDRLIEAFAMLAEGGDVGRRKLVLAGGGGGMAYDVEEAIAKAGAKGKVVVTGYVQDEEIVALMNMADLFVYPSLYEGFGLPPLEAMACGTPTVVSDATCLPEVVGEGALVAPAEDVSALAEAMDKGLSDLKLRRSLIQRGRKRAADFTWKRAAGETLALYESVSGGAE